MASVEREREVLTSAVDLLISLLLVHGAVDVVVRNVVDGGSAEHCCALYSQDPSQ